MPELSMSVQITRSALGLSDLELNDHTNYYIGAQFLGGSTAWQRNQVTSPWVDGSVTVNRTRTTINENIEVEVLGSTTSVLRDNLKTLIDAVSQDSWRLNITMNGVPISYQCESADYTIAWNGPRVIAGQLQVNLSIPRQPVPLAGV